MSSFTQRLAERAHQADTLLCVGLDPHPELLPEATAEAARAFCLRLIGATSEAACAFKANSAFFEALGAEGWRALQEVVAAVPEGIPVIVDAKRGDIASSARAYARAVFHGLGADAVTVNPYLGWDALEPLAADPRVGVFLLCKTSNPGAQDLQSQRLEGGPQLYVHVARMAVQRNTRGNLGLVVGATDVGAVGVVRREAPDMWILAPGVGAQGGDLVGAVRAGVRSDGLGLLIAVSRGIAGTVDPGEEARKLRDRIRRARDEAAERTTSVLPRGLAPLANALLEAGCVRFGDFTLKSGRRSPIYLDLRLLASHPALLARTATAYLPLLQGLEFDCLAAVPYAGLPIATAISLQSGRPLIYPRKEVKDYGTRAPVEGVFREGDRAVLIDDLATTGGSKFEAIDRLSAAGLQVKDVVVLIDRQGGASQALAESGYRLHAVFGLIDLIDHWEAAGLLPGSQAAAVRAFVRSTDREA